MLKIEKNFKAKKSEKSKKGISLILLVITIIIIIILSVTVILTIADNNLVNNAKQATFINDLGSFQDELNMYISGKYTKKLGVFDLDNLNANSEYIIEDGIKDTNKNILDVLKSLKGTKYETKIEIIKGKISYVGNNEQEIIWAKQNNIKVESEPYNKRLENKIIVGYWENWVSGEPNTLAMKLSKIPDYYDIINITFAYTKEGMQSGEVGFILNDYLSTYIGYSNEEFKQDIINIQNKGTKVLLSIGGEGKNIYITNDTEVNNFVNSVSTIIDEYGFNGIDLDIEMSSGVNVEYFEKATRALYEKYNENLLITINANLTSMIEDGMDGATNNYNYKLSINMKDILGLVSARYYNSGTKSGYDFPNPWSREQGHISFITSLATIQLERMLEEKQVGICIVSGEEKASSTGTLPPAYLSPEDMVKTFKSLIEGIDPQDTYRPFIPPKTYPNTRGIVIWSINNDATKGYQMTLTLKKYFESL